MLGCVRGGVGGCVGRVRVWLCVWCVCVSVVADVFVVNRYWGIGIG